MNIENIVVSFKEKRKLFPVKELLRCRVEGIEVIEGNSFYENLTGKLVVEQINPSWLIFSGGFQKSATRRFLKRSVDLLLSSSVLLILSPLILLIAAIAPEYSSRNDNFVMSLTTIVVLRHRSPLCY